MGATAAFLALSAASTGMQAIGQIQQGKAQQRAANFQAKVQEQQARSEREAAAAEAEDFRRRFSRQRAGAIARAGGSGVELGAGSPLLVLEDFEKEAALQSSRLLHSGNVRAGRLEQQADLTRAGGRSARRAGVMRAGGSLLSGGASMLSGMQSFS